MPVLLLPAANRQHMIKANRDILLPEPQHRLQIVRRKSDIDDVFRQLHLPTAYSNGAPANFSETSQSLTAVAVSRACGMSNARAHTPSMASTRARPADH